jgi:hypothetical protein
MNRRLAIGVLGGVAIWPGMGVAQQMQTRV